MRLIQDKNIKDSTIYDTINNTDVNININTSRKEKKIKIFIMGNIGVGKTTLA